MTEHKDADLQAADAALDALLRMSPAPRASGALKARIMADFEAGRRAGAQAAGDAWRVDWRDIFARLRIAFLPPAGSLAGLAVLGLVAGFSLSAPPPGGERVMTAAALEAEALYYADDALAQLFPEESEAGL